MVCNARFITVAISHLKEDELSVLLNSSNLIDLTLVPLFVTYYLPERGVQVTVLHFTNFPGETYCVMVTEEKSHCLVTTR
jgi:hypothetical protein